ncbi:hypothetical protein PMJGCIOK_00018 [Scale drop disease virus]|nr:hypothetical protein PMJGCIOK_00018 [Scale drop disease virus]
MELLFHNLQKYLIDMIEAIPAELTQQRDSVEYNINRQIVPYYLTELESMLSAHFNQLYINRVHYTLINLNDMTHITEQDFINMQLKTLLSQFSNRTISLIYFDYFINNNTLEWLQKIENLFKALTHDLEIIIHQVSDSLIKSTRQYNSTVTKFDSLQQLWFSSPIALFIESCKALHDKQKLLSDEINQFTTIVPVNPVTKNEANTYLNNIDYKDILLKTHPFPNLDFVQFNSGSLDSQPITLNPRVKYIMFIGKLVQQKPTVDITVSINVALNLTSDKKQYVGSMPFYRERLTTGRFLTRPILLSNPIPPYITMSLELTPADKIKFSEIEVKVIFIYDTIFTT